MKRFVLHILAVIVTFGFLLFLGFNTLSIKTVTSNKKSSYLLTDFSYVVLNPSNDQISNFESRPDIIKSVFPVYNFESNLKGTKTSKLNLLLSPSYEKYEAGLFNDKLLISGSHKDSGLSLDEYGAKLLGVKVGDSVSTSLGGQLFTFTVDAIYRTSTYVGLDEGLAQAKFTNEMSELFTAKMYYDYAFINTSNKAACGQLLKDYVPLGPLMTEQEYIDDIKSSQPCPVGLTDEEWTESLKQNYVTYRDNYLSQDFDDCVQDKDEMMKNIIDQTQSSDKRVNALSILGAVAIIVLYPVLMILFTFANKKYDHNQLEAGEDNIAKKYNRFITFATIISASLLFAIFALYAVSIGYFMDFLPIIVCFSIPLVISLAIVIPVLSKGYYKKNLVKTSIYQ